jgi:hypothetical protein
MTPRCSPGQKSWAPSPSFSAASTNPPTPSGAAVAVPSIIIATDSGARGKRCDRLLVPPTGSGGELREARFLFFLFFGCERDVHLFTRETETQAEVSRASIAVQITGVQRPILRLWSGAA